MGIDSLAAEVGGLDAHLVVLNHPKGILIRYAQGPTASFDICQPWY